MYKVKKQNKNIWNKQQHTEKKQKALAMCTVPADLGNHGTWVNK